MKTSALIVLLAITSLFMSCNKGKKMPKTVYVSMDLSNIDVYVVDGIDPTCQILYNYTNAIDGYSEAYSIQSRLGQLFQKNNVSVTSDTSKADYRLTIDQITVSENFNSDTYFDTCYSQFQEDVLLSSVTYWFDVTLRDMETGNAVATYSISDGGDENLCNSEGCGGYSIDAISLYDIRNSIAKRLRKKLCNIIYEDMGF